MGRVGFALYTLDGLSVDSPVMRLSTQRIRQLGSSQFNYWFGYLANIALVAWMASHAMRGGHILLRLPAVLTCIVAGFCLWTLLEYLLHRFVYHIIASSLQIGHRLHHERPKALIGVPWYLSGVLVIATFQSVITLVPKPAAAVVCSATWLGYIGYCILHHASHHWSLRRRYLRRMKKHHLVHHAHPDYNWGFTTAFWDVMFGTAYKPHAMPNKSHDASDFV